MRSFCIFDMSNNNNIYENNIVTNTNSEFFICPEKGSNITIGFVEPELDNTFDRHKEQTYLQSLGLEYEYISEKYSPGSYKIKSKDDPNLGNIKSFIMYAIIAGEVKEFIVSRTISVKDETYVVNPINVTPMSDWDKYTVQNGNFQNKTPSILTINS